MNLKRFRQISCLDRNEDPRVSGDIVLNWDSNVS